MANHPRSLDDGRKPAIRAGIGSGRAKASGTALESLGVDLRVLFAVVFSGEGGGIRGKGEKGKRGKGEKGFRCEGAFRRMSSTYTSFKPLPTYSVSAWGHDAREPGRKMRSNAKTLFNYSIQVHGGY